MAQRKRCSSPQASVILTRSAGVGHAECTSSITDAFRQFVRYPAIAIAAVRRPITPLKGCVARRSASAASRTVGILSIGATKLIHEVRDNSVKVNAIVETSVCKTMRGP